MEYIFVTSALVKKYWHQIEVDELNESEVTNPFDYIEDCYHGKVKYGGCLVVIKEDLPSVDMELEEKMRPYIEGVKYGDK